MGHGLRGLHWDGGPRWKPALTPPAVEALIENLGWMRALARRLITDPHLADDALQETWFAASRGESPADRPGRPWLAKVLRNRARAEHRSRSARERRERLTARVEIPVPDPGEIVAEAELGQLLGRAVLELEEPYRRTVLLRYWQGLGPDEIARIEQVPASTVRTRLQRALEHLRARVARDFKDEQGGWRRALLPLAALGHQPLVGGLVMLKKIQLVTAIVVAALAVGTIAWQLTAPDPSVRTPRIDREDEVTLLEPALTGESDLAESRGGHDRVEAAAPERVAGVVRAMDGQAVAGALITLRVPAGGDGRELGASDDAGRFLLDLPLDPEGRLVVRAVGFLEKTLWPEEFPHDPGASFEIVLESLGTLEVTVIDEHEAAVEGVTVHVRSHLQGAAGKAWTRDVLRIGLTGSDGRAVLEELPCGVALSVTLGIGPIRGVTEIDPATRRTTIEVRRITPGNVSGTVLDRTGAPAEGVRVVLEESRLSWNRQALTDAHGRYSFADEVSPGPIEVRARSVGTEFITGSVTGVLEPGTTLELDPLRMAELDVNLRDLGLDLLRDGERLLEEVLWLDDEGRFETQVPPGPVLVRVSQHATFIRSTPGAMWERGSRKELGEVGRALYEAPATGVEIPIDGGIGALEGELVTSSAEALEGGLVSLHFYPGQATIGELLRDSRAFLWQQVGLPIEGGLFRSRAI